MKRKIVIMISLIMISMGLMACGSKGSDLGEQKEETIATNADTQPPEDRVEKEEVISQSNDVTILEELESEAENSEIIEQEEVKPTWYMDSEGIKNDELGVIIRKDNAMLKSIYLRETVSVPTSAFGAESIRCEYYEGDLDKYIAEHSADYEKGMLEDVDYAYNSSSSEVVFAGNGIVALLSANALHFEDIGISDFLEQINLVKSYDESCQECLAYITSDGLYCPALGIKFSCDGGENRISNIQVCYEWARETANISIQDEGIYQSSYVVDTENAQEVVDKFVESKIHNEYSEKEYSAVEETDEINIGKYKYLGRGVVEIGKYFDVQTWLFYSDNTTWSISVYSHDDGLGSKCEDYLYVLESLE